MESRSLSPEKFPFRVSGRRCLEGSPEAPLFRRTSSPGRRPLIPGKHLASLPAQLFQKKGLLKVTDSDRSRGIESLRATGTNFWLVLIGSTRRWNKPEGFSIRKPSNLEFGAGL